MKKIVLLFIFIHLFLFPKRIYAFELSKNDTTAKVQTTIIAHAIINNIDPELALYVAYGESSFDTQEIGDMKIPCPLTGKPVRARGLWQITECFHPEISDDIAFSLESSTEWAMKILSDKRKCIREWTICRNYYK